MSTEAMKLALDALEKLNNTKSYWWQEVDEDVTDQLLNAETALQEALAQPQQEPVCRTDQQIVDQTEELAVWLLSWGFNLKPNTDVPMRESINPFANRCWLAACHIQEMLTATDPENAVAELDVEPYEGTSSPAQSKRSTN